MRISWKPNRFSSHRGKSVSELKMQCHVVSMVIDGSRGFDTVVKSSGGLRTGGPATVFVGQAYPVAPPSAKPPPCVLERRRSSVRPSLSCPSQRRIGSARAEIARPTHRISSAWRARAAGGSKARPLPRRAPRHRLPGLSRAAVRSPLRARRSLHHQAVSRFPNAPDPTRRPHRFRSPLWRSGEAPRPHDRSRSDRRHANSWAQFL